MRWVAKSHGGKHNDSPIDYSGCIEYYAFLRALFPDDTLLPLTVNGLLATFLLAGLGLGVEVLGFEYVLFLAITVQSPQWLGWI